MLFLFKKMLKRKPKEGRPAPSEAAPSSASNEAISILADIQSDMISMQKKIDENVKKLSFVKDNVSSKQSAYVVRGGKKLYWCDRCAAYTRLTESAEHCVEHRLAAKPSTKIKARI